MAVDFTGDQISTVKKLQEISGIILDQIARAKLIVAEASDLGYGNGGANAITDAFLNGGTPPNFPKLTAADVFAAALWLSNLDAALAATTVAPTGATRAGYKALEKMRAT